MRRPLIALCLVASPAIVHAQRDTSERLFQPLPADVRREVVDRWNGPNALKASERTDVSVGTEVEGNVAVLAAPLVIAGHVKGNVLA
ncbi:MAG TPA: hypothetical protein VHV78_06430, partial [Gemmatimonadaceae bacterium]|nr:hypothetical protein [Gemmatimonadaceae bacterium]